MKMRGNLTLVVLLNLMAILTLIDLSVNLVCGYKTPCELSAPLVADQRKVADFMIYSNETMIHAVFHTGWTGVFFLETQLYIGETIPHNDPGQFPFQNLYQYADISNFYVTLHDLGWDDWKCEIYVSAYGLAEGGGLRRDAVWACPAGAKKFGSNGCYFSLNLCDCSIPTSTENTDVIMENAKIVIVLLICVLLVAGLYLVLRARRKERDKTS